jgi:hypothetical protein
VTKEGIKPFAPSGYRTLNARTAMFFYATGITRAMIMRLPDIGSQYLGAMLDSKGEYFDGSKTCKVALPPNIPALPSPSSCHGITGTTDGRTTTARPIANW